MSDSESDALPLGDIPMNAYIIYKIHKSQIFSKIDFSRNFHIIFVQNFLKTIMATKKISIELLQDVAHMGRKGDIIEVSSAQARNSLIPKKIAIEVTPERLKKIAQDKKRLQDQARERLEKAFEIQKTLE